VPGVEPIVEGALVLEPLVPSELEPMLPELVPVDIPVEPVAGELPAAPPLLPALCAKAAPQANESTAADASRIRLMLRPPEL
jgi:hypothetical protein